VPPAVSARPGLTRHPPLAATAHHAVDVAADEMNDRRPVIRPLVQMLRDGTLDRRKVAELLAGHTYGVPSSDPAWIGGSISNSDPMPVIVISLSSAGEAKRSVTDTPRRRASR
jgi:hypothetical protein